MGVGVLFKICPSSLARVALSSTRSCLSALFSRSSVCIRGSATCSGCAFPCFDVVDAEPLSTTSPQVIFLPGCLELDLDIAASVGPAPSAVGFDRDLNRPLEQERPLERERRMGMEPSATSFCMYSGSLTSSVLASFSERFRCCRLRRHTTYGIWNLFLQQRSPVGCTAACRNASSARAI